jgi:hypothetical protein
MGLILLVHLTVLIVGVLGFAYPADRGLVVSLAWIFGCGVARRAQAGGGVTLVPVVTR